MPAVFFQAEGRTPSWLNGRDQWKKAAQCKNNGVMFPTGLPLKWIKLAVYFLVAFYWSASLLFVIACHWTGIFCIAFLFSCVCFSTAHLPTEKCNHLLLLHKFIYTLTAYKKTQTCGNWHFLFHKHKVRLIYSWLWCCIFSPCASYFQCI